MFHHPSIPNMGEVKAMNIPMKIVVAGLLSGVISLASFAHVIDKYDFTMHLYVPRVYDNMQSLGYRRYQP